MFREWILSRHYVLDSVSKEHEANGPHSSRAFSEAWRVNTKHVIRHVNLLHKWHEKGDENTDW